ncbi:sortase [Candidatus Saccharibacteria bacterium]|nr:sortase [Candidatus Saccharibacteria bacterium]
MKPDENNSSQGGLSLTQQMLAHNKPENDDDKSPNEAAVNVLRMQIDHIYDDDPGINEDHQSVNSEAIEPMKSHHQSAQTQTNDWQHYHSAWQNYYQKYYEGYYNQKQKSVKSDDKFFVLAPPEQSDIVSDQQAVADIKEQIVNKVKESATKVKKSRHFIPISAGILVVLFFAFLQYNRFLIANVVAYVSPGSIDAQNIVIDPSANLTVPPEPKLIIPKINVDVPVFYDVGSDYKSQMDAMAKGVAHFAINGASSHPGQVGNTVIAGHSSNDWLDGGDYKFIFAQLEKVNVGDTVYANYNSVRYTYIVTKKEVVKPNEVNKLVYPTTKPMLTLLTCVPLGTAINRLLVTAEQFSPDPTKSTAAPENKGSDNQTIPGNSPTFIERLFGAN